MARPLYPLSADIERAHASLSRTLAEGHLDRTGRPAALQRLRRLDTARRLADELLAAEARKGLPSPDDLVATLTLVRHCMSGHDAASTAMREQIVQIKGSVTLGQVIDAALAADMHSARAA